MYTGHATKPTIIAPASVYFSTAEMRFVGGPTTTEAFLLHTIPVFDAVIKRDAIGRNIMNFIMAPFVLTRKSNFYCNFLRNFFNVHWRVKLVLIQNVTVI